MTTHLLSGNSGGFPVVAANHRMNYLSEVTESEIYQGRIFITVAVRNMWCGAAVWRRKTSNNCDEWAARPMHTKPWAESQTQPKKRWLFYCH